MECQAVFLRIAGPLQISILDVRFVNSLALTRGCTQPKAGVPAASFRVDGNSLVPAKVRNWERTPTGTNLAFYTVRKPLLQAEFVL